MTYALSNLNDEDALQLLTGLHGLTKAGGVAKMAVAETITLIGNLGFVIDRPGGDAAEPVTHNVGTVLQAIKDQVISLPRGGS